VRSCRTDSPENAGPITPVSACVLQRLGEMEGNQTIIFHYQNSFSCHEGNFSFCSAGK